MSRYYLQSASAIALPSERYRSDIRLHVRYLLINLVAVVFPVGSFERDESAVGLLIIESAAIPDVCRCETYVNHSHPALLVLGDDPQCFYINNTVGLVPGLVCLALVLSDIGMEQMLGVVGLEPLLQ